VLLALSQEGGTVGERSLPLLVSDSDWDLLGDRIAGLLSELEDQDLARLLLGLEEALTAELEPTHHAELESLAHYVLGSSRRVWEKQPRALPVFALEAWYALRRWVREPVDSPSIGRTWTELHPTSSLFIAGITAGELRALDDWLALAQALARHDRAALGRSCG